MFLGVAIFSGRHLLFSVLTVECFLPFALPPSSLPSPDDPSPPEPPSSERRPRFSPPRAPVTDPLKSLLPSSE